MATIERTGKMKVHKNLVIRVLQEYPEELVQVAPEWRGTAEELIDALEADPREWIIGGELADAPE